MALKPTRDGARTVAAEVVGAVAVEAGVAVAEAGVPMAVAEDCLPDCAHIINAKNFMVQAAEAGAAMVEAGEVAVAAGVRMAVVVAGTLPTAHRVEAAAMLRTDPPVVASSGPRLTRTTLR